MPEPLIRYQLTDEGLKAALTALGTDLYAVVRNLSAMDVRGRRGVECECALAAYLALVVEHASRVHVYLDDDDTEVFVIAQRRVDGEVVDQATASVAGSLPVFVRLFDRGRYPELEVSDAAA
jgi:hypothetical protein